jgi:DNA-binding MarR family transcriptional regulator
MLIAVGRFGSPSLKELAHALDVSAPSASTMVDRLVEMRMLTRETSRVDRREVVVTLSAEGRSMAARMEEEILESLGEILQKLGTEYADLWCRVFAEIRTVLADEEDSGGVMEQTNE